MQPAEHLNFKEVYDTASVSTVPGIPEGARGMLANVTQGADVEGFRVASQQFADACTSIGH